MIYLDNASTSYPKSSVMRQFIAHFYDDPVGSYGRTFDDHTLDLAMAVERLRDHLSDLIGGRGGEHVVMTSNATEAINMVVCGLEDLRREEVLISPMSHNAVTRPINALRGMTYGVMPSMSDGGVDIEALELMLRSNSSPYRLAIITGMSNVTGRIEEIGKISRIIKQHSPSTLILVDAAQALPYMLIKVRDWHIDFVAMTGHKGLLGPTGTGALYVDAPLSIKPMIRGGNGYRSDQQIEITVMPDRFEAGTLNLLGLAALEIALTHDQPSQISHECWISFIRKVRDLKGIKVLGASEDHLQGPLFSIVSDKYPPSVLGDHLLKDYGIITRSGKHCAPLAYETLGGLALGATRISISPFTSNTELDVLYQSLCMLHE